MTQKEREEVRKKAASMGLRSSSYDSSVQFDDKSKVKHIDDNRTLIKGKMYYGASDAKKALDDLK